MKFLGAFKVFCRTRQWLIDREENNRWISSRKVAVSRRRFPVPAETLVHRGGGKVQRARRTVVGLNAGCCRSGAAQRVRKCVVDVHLGELADQARIVAAEVDDPVVLGAPLEHARSFFEKSVTRIRWVLPTMRRLIS